MRLPWAFEQQRTDPAGDYVPVRSPNAARHAAYRTARASKGDAQVEHVLLRRDPALVERAIDAHGKTQTALADLVRRGGAEPLSPGGAVDYDLAWRDDRPGVFLAEIKSHH